MKLTDFDAVYSLKERLAHYNTELKKISDAATSLPNLEAKNCDITFSFYADQKMRAYLNVPVTHTHVDHILGILEGSVLEAISKTRAELKELGVEA